MNHGLVRVDDSVREVLQPCVQLGKIVVGMFFGLPPAFLVRLSMENTSFSVEGMHKVDRRH